MGWKELPRWVKGGIIGAIIYGIVIIIIGIIEFSNCDPVMCGFATMMLSRILLPIIPVGAIIGWIYGKIKQRKEEPILQN